MADHPVFISYARKTSRAYAEALHRELGGDTGLAFLDTSEIETLQKFPAEISDALLAAKVVVVFADETYFTQRYCLREFETALAPFQALVRRNAPDGEKDQALLHLVIALPRADVSRQLMDQLPSSLRLTLWPQASDAKVLGEAVGKRLEGATLSLQQDLIRILGDAEAEMVGKRFREQAALPSPASLRGITLFPTQMPSSLDEGFKGRADDLWRLHHELSTVAAGDAPRSVAIEGGGGFGKTRLALEYFHRFGPIYYRGGLFWLDANVGAEEIEPRFHEILRAIRLDTPDLKAFRESRRNARDELADALQQLPGEAGVLFVVDNIPEPELGDPPKGLEEWCPGAGMVTVLSTSRKIASSQGASVHPLNLDVLPPEPAVDLLTYGNQRSALAYEDWRSIAEWVGRLPLALELLQRAMQARAISPRELFDLANENRGTTKELDGLMGVLHNEVPAGALRGITEAFDNSYNLLPENAREAARLLACLAPEPIPLDVLKAMGDEPSSGAARAALIGRSFITRPETLGDAAQPFEIFGRMHKLLADFIRAKSPDGPGDLRRAATALIDVMDPDFCRDPARWPLMNASLPHAELVFAALLWGGEKEDAEFAVDAGLRMGILHGAQGAAKKARKVEERTREFASKRLGPEDHWTLSAMNNLAWTLRDQGDLEGARKLKEQVLDARTRILGGEHPYTLTAMSNLAGTLRAQGELEGARKLQQQVLDARKRILGGEHPDTLTAMNNLAGTLYTQGDLEGARKLQEQVLDASKRILGGEHPNTTVSAANLFLTLRDQGKTERANTIVEQNLKWLLKRDPETLSDQQRQVRGWLEKFLRKPR
jgi:tetratricopeptide (TPR) repeat protein